MDARRADRAPIPSIPVGALIGRIGNGERFSLGDTTNGSGVVVFTNAQNGHRIWQRMVTEVMGPDHPSGYFFMT